MILGTVAEHDFVLVRARVVTVFAHACLVAVPAVRGEDLEMVSIADLYRPPPTDAAYFAAQAVLREIALTHTSLSGLAERLIAELNELGGHAMTAKDQAASRP